MKKNLKHIILLCLLLFTLKSISQSQAANWFFGENAALSFNNGTPINLPDSQLNTAEGCSSISDKFGNLLFYSDGLTVWNKNHTIMPNGTGLLGNASSTQSALIVPKPNSISIYYIFTVDDRAGVNGLRYTEINMSSNSGLGAVTFNKNILLTTPTTEKITAVEHADGERIWLISHKWNSNEFIAYLISNTGVNTVPIVSAVGSMHSGDLNNSIGYLKASPNREKIACVKSYSNNETQIFDFEATTGIISNPKTISNYSSELIGPYGCEFSPNSQLLYISEINNNTNSSIIHQYDLTQTTEAGIINSDVIVAQGNIEFGALQQAIDGRIYIAKNDVNSLGVITNPNTLGLDCNYIENGVFLGNKRSKFGLPPFIQSYFYATNVFSNTCFGDDTSFNINTATIIDAILWDFGDPISGINNNSTLINPTHVFTNPGEYTVTINIDTEGEIQTIYRQLTIAPEPPILNLDPILSCEITNEEAAYNLLSAIPDTIINDTNIAIYFFETFNDADANTNQIFNPDNYTNISNPQTIYIRLQNSVRGDCFSISELELITIQAPIIEDLETVLFCENTESDYAIITVGNLVGPLSDYNFLWLETLETTPEIQVTDTGDYTVRITIAATITPENPDGCYADRVVTVESSSIAIINNIEIPNGNTIQVIVSGLGNYEYALDNISGPYQSLHVFFGMEAGLHTVYVRDKNNCGIVEQTISVIGFPKFFTPNNDGINDYWQVQGVSEVFQPNSKIKIYNRHGKLIKQISPLSKGWDGTFNGKYLPNDDYWFAVTLQDGREFFNHFTLKR